MNDAAPLQSTRRSGHARINMEDPRQGVHRRVVGLLVSWNVPRYPTLANSRALDGGWVLHLSGPPLPTSTPTSSPPPASEPVRLTPTPFPEPIPSASSVSQGTSLVSLRPLTASVWDATVRYFSISGRNPTQLFASDEANGQTPKDALAYVGPTSWDFQPTYVFSPTTGSCTLTGVVAQTTYRATIPRWRSPAGATRASRLVEEGPGAHGLAREPARPHLRELRDLAAGATCRAAMLRGADDHQQVDSRSECGPRSL
jgi:Predicted secreted Zn-dependent protease